MSDDAGRMTICEHSGRTVLSCKVSDLCDCFDHPEADEAAARITHDRSRRFVEEALEAADAGNAGHWPTVAAWLAAEVRWLRAVDAQQRCESAAEALEQAADEAERLWVRQGLTGPVFVAHRTPRWLRDRAAALRDEPTP